MRDDMNFVINRRLRTRELTKYRSHIDCVSSDLCGIRWSMQQIGRLERRHDHAMAKLRLLCRAILTD